MLFAAIADGTTEIIRFPDRRGHAEYGEGSADARHPRRGDGAGRLTVHGKGLDGLSEPSGVLDLGNSGTGMRLLAGLLAGQDFFSVLTGDQYLVKRPMGRIVEPLRAMGAVIDGRSGGKLAPLSIRGAGKNTRPLSFQSPVASAQVKSAVLSCGLYADGVTTVSEPSKSRDHTERMLPVLRRDGEGRGAHGQRQGESAPSGEGPLEIPADISSAAFFMVAASIVPGSDLLIRNVGVNPTRTGIIDVLTSMGADISLLVPERTGR